VSLRGITQTVLRSYPGMEGGFYANSDFLGYAYPTHDTGTAKTDVPSAERSLIVSLAQQSLKTNQIVQQVVRGRTDLLVLGALADQNHATVTWAMKGWWDGARRAWAATNSCWPFSCWLP
jgi:hypothetical protein